MLCYVKVPLSCVCSNMWMRARCAGQGIDSSTKQMRGSEWKVERERVRRGEGTCKCERINIADGFLFSHATSTRRPRFRLSGGVITGCTVCNHVVRTDMSKKSKDRLRDLAL